MRKSTIAILSLLLVGTAPSPFAQETEHTQVAQRTERSRSFISAPGREAVERISIAQPFAHYKLDGDVRDSSENRLHGFNAEAKPTLDRFGKSGKALEFDGVNDFLTLPININPKYFQQLTMCAWVRPDGNSNYDALLSHDTAGFDRSITMHDREGQRWWYGYGGDAERLEISTDLSIGKWYFVAAVYDQAAGIVRFHVDDELIRKKGRCGSGYDEIRVGMEIHSVNFFHGAIDDIRIYDHALTVEDINALYTLKDE